MTKHAAEPLTMAEAAASTVPVFGLHDTKDDCWIGNAEGPLLYGLEEIAKVAALVVDGRMQRAMGRTRAKAYDFSGNKKKDVLMPTRAAENVMERLERGAS